jgi:NADPH:quinone reductase-like Zn-dependent oxidoreductase
MVFEYGAVDATRRVLVHGAAGNVGAYAVQLATRGAHDVVATAFSDDVAYVQTLGADRVIDLPTLMSCSTRSAATRRTDPSPS